MKLRKSSVAVRHVQEPEAIRDRKSGAEMQVQGLVAHDVEERIRPERRRDREAREARRLLYALDAIITLHLAAEEELLSQVEDLPAHG